MRSALILVLALLFCGQSQAEEIIASVSSSRSDLTFERLNGYDVVRMADCDMTREVGEPQLPVKLVHMAVPPGMKVDGFRILAVDREEVEGAYDLFPVQPPQILGMPGKVVQTLDFAGPKKDVYGSDSPYPEDIVELSAMGSFRGHRLASLLVHPLQYIPAQRKLLLYTRIEFGVSFIPDGDAPRMLRRRSERREDVCRPFVERLVLNPQDVGEPYALSNLQESPLPEGDYEYVIVTDPEYEPIFRPLADWKTRKGVAATIVTTSWIYRQYTGVDAQEQIRNFIRDAYQNWGAVWVLIGGDTDIVPVRLAWAMDCQMDPADNDLPCDLYYSDLDGTWDTNGNGIYGQVDDGVDLYPEVFVGRAPVDKPKEARTFVRKVMEYERGVDTQYQLKMLFAAEILWSDPYTDAGEGKNMIEEECIPSRFAPITKLYHSLGNESVQSVVAAMNQGHHIINHDGHAWYTDMCVGEGCLSTWDIDGLTNGPRQSILYSIGCWPGAIDYDCIGEHFVTNPRGGGVAFIGNSRYGWGSPGNPGYGYSDRFDHRFYQELFQDRISHIGATLAAAKAFYVGRSQQENVYRWHQYQLNLLGDPEMDIWTDLPVALTVDQPAEVPTGPSTFTLTVTSTTTPVEGALACLMNGTDLYHRGTTDSQGRVAFNINPDGVDTVWVTVTAHDHLPYKGFATLFAEGPYVSCWTQTIQDSMGGNGDGLINPGETIGLNVHLKNYGDEDATGVTGILRTDDPLVNVLDSLFAFGSIPSGQISAVTIYDSDCYTLEVSPQAENSHTVHFTLEISDSLGNVWTDIIPITVAAPLLICERYSIDDSTGGDGDGLIELGETVWLEVEIKNRGLGIAYGVTLHPQTESCDVAILDSLVNLGDIPPDSTVARSFSIELFPAACPSPPMDTYTLTMATSDGFPFTDGFSLAREQALWEFSDDMESGDTLWTHSGQGDLWHLTQHRSHSGDFSWYCGSEGQWRYDKFMDCSLVSSPITLGPRAHLSFWHWYEVATYGVNGILVEIDDGSGWRKLDFIGSGGALQPLLPVGNDWLEDTYDLAEYPAGSQVQIRFRFVSDGERVSEGVYIDDVRVFSDYSTPFPLLDLVGFTLDDDTLGLSTGNGNGFLDPGERVELTVTLLNYGDAMAPGVTASLSTNDPHTTVLNGYSNLGDIPPGTELSGADNFRVSVSKDAPNRHTIYLSLRLEDAKGHVWDESVELKVAQPDFAFHSFAINDAIGNGDGVPDRGETCSLILTLKNSGLRSAAGITATVTTSCADVVIVDGASAFTDIPVDSVGDNRGWPFIFHIMGSATEHIIPFQVHLTEGGGFCQADVTVNVLMGQRRVLLVADDGAYSNSGYYEQVLKAMGIPYRLWSVIDQGAIPLDKLMSFGDLIWFTGPEAGETLTEEDQEALSQFLDSGGHLILSGQMIGMNIGRTDFYSQYLRAKYVSFMTELHNLKGVEENPVTDGIYIHLATQGLNAQGWPGEIDPVPPAFGIFEYDQTTEEGPGRILSSGMGAVAVETDDYKVAYFSFGLEGIEPFESRYEVIEALFSWFRGSPIDVRAVLAFSDWSIDDDDQGASQGDGDGFANPGETIELKVSLVNTGLLAGENVVGALRTSDEFISIVDSTVSFGDIDPDSVVGSLDAFVLSISEGTPQGHQATFDLIMTDTPGNRWSDGFGLTVYLTSTVSGRITDVYDGRGIPGATLHWLGPINEITGGYEGEGWSAADDDGNYLLSLINGRYWIRGEAPGFLPSHWLNILFPPDTSGVDFALTSPRIECEPDSLTIQLNPGGTGQRNLEVSNVYSGVLQYAILQMEPSLLVQMGACFTVDSLRPFILHPDSMPKLPQGAVETDAPVPDPERWRLIYIDGDEPDNTFDLDRMYAQNDDRDLYFKITAHEPWSNPRTGLDLYIWIDADNNVQTGAFSWGLGAEYLLITGSGSYLLRWNPRREYFDFQSYLPYEKLPSNADSLEVGIHLADIGGPQRVNLVFVFFNIEKGRVDDVAPDGGFYIPYSLYNAEWLWVNPTFGQVAAGRTDEITLSFDATGLLPGEYNLNLVIENNQPDGGPVVIPVRLTVGQTTVEGTDPSILPTEYALAQNYPNPFNPYTDIRYQIPDGRSPLLTALKVYNILGQHVRTLVNEEQEAGYYTVTWDGRNDRGNEVSSGIYFYRMEAGDFRNTKRMLLLK